MDFVETLGVFYLISDISSHHFPSPPLACRHPKPLSLESLESLFSPTHKKINNAEHVWLVVDPTPLKIMSSSVGKMTFPTEWKVIKFHVPNHQPDVDTSTLPFKFTKLIQIRISVLQFQTARPGKH